ncbi:MAG: flagellin [Lachnospiraceae bacterium]|nr:flagellin [Lachnospiraceae bacterium]SEI65914.1 flagellin [Lachnospiraceae bacterium A10]
MVVQHNLQAMNTNRQLGITTSAQAKSTEKLSSGYKINRAADDAAGLAISEKMRSQIRGLDRASTNASDGISVVQTAEGALNEVHAMLQRMNELATQAANDTNTSVDRNSLKLEVDQLACEIDRIASSTQFNTMNLLDGTFTGKNLQVGALSGQAITICIDKLTSSGLNLGAQGSALKLSSFQSAGESMSLVQQAIDKISTQRATLGAIQNRLEHTIANLDTTSENTSASESRIRDTDMAAEMVTYSKNNILAQAGQSMLAQANQSTQGVMSLLQ